MQYFLGCPGWGVKAWVGGLYPVGARAADYLRHYSAVFNTVEGNTSFYRVPRAETLRGWAETVPAGFRFCLKFPKKISHERKLRGAEQDTEWFLEAARTLGEKLGVLWLQLPPSLGPRSFDRLEAYLRGLPGGFHYGLEPRHALFYANGEPEERLNALLAALGIERIGMDTRPLRSAAPDDEATRTAQDRKPDLPPRPMAVGKHPLVRFVGRIEPEKNDPWLDEWADHVARWIREGRQPFVMIHSPGEGTAPEIARRWHAKLGARVPLDPLPAWPGELGQMSLI